MGTITELDAGGVSSFNDITNKPTTTLTGVNIVDSDNLITHNIGTNKGQTVVDVIVYTSTGENIPVSNWQIIDENSLTLPSTVIIPNARIEILSK